MKNLLLLLTVALSLQVQAKYVDGDGDFDLVCKQKDESARPYNTFQLKLMVEDSTGKNSTELLTDGTSLYSGNGDIVYEVKSVQFPSYGADTPTLPQTIIGCEAAPLSMNINANSTAFELYFECNGDGDAGFGLIHLNIADGSVVGEISFPEGQQQLLYPLMEDTKIAVECGFTN